MTTSSAHRGSATYESRSLNQIEAQFDHDIILTAQYLRDLAGDPSRHGTASARTLVASGREGSRTHFFMTCRLTLVMSTFWLNSGGNLVLLRSFASTPVAILGDVWLCDGSRSRRAGGRKDALGGKGGRELL